MDRRDFLKSTVVAFAALVFPLPKLTAAGPSHADRIRAVIKRDRIYAHHSDGFGKGSQPLGTHVPAAHDLLPGSFVAVPWYMTLQDPFEHPCSCIYFTATIEAPVKPDWTEAQEAAALAEAAKDPLLAVFRLPKPTVERWQSLMDFLASDPANLCYARTKASPCSLVLLRDREMDCWRPRVVGLDE
jgi:hypothetical protein